MAGTKQTEWIEKNDLLLEWDDIAKLVMPHRRAGKSHEATGWVDNR